MIPSQNKGSVVGINNDDLPRAVLGQKENMRRRELMIERQRQERQKLEWAHRVVEWAWFAGATIFLLGVLFGASFYAVISNG